MVDDIVYEICCWVIFFPYVLARILLVTGSEIGRYYEHLSGKDARPYFVSAPSFLLCACLIQILLSPASDDIELTVIKQIGAIMGSNVAGSKVIQDFLLIAILATSNAIFIEYVTPGGISRESFRVPLFINFFAVAPLPVLSGLQSAFENYSSRPDDWFGSGLWIFDCAMTLYYFRAQYFIYNNIGRCSRTLSIVWSCVGLLTFLILAGVIALTFANIPA